MRKLMLAVAAGCMSLAVSSAYAASGSPVDTDKAGRAGPGTAMGELGAAKPTPSAPGATKGGAASTTTGSTSATTTGAGSSATATTGGAMDDTKGRRTRRA